jgi:hypothetical protein
VAALRPSDEAAFSVNAGSVAVRVLVRAGVPPPFAVVLVLGRVVAVDVLPGVGVPVLVVCETAGVPATDTVFVPEPHAPSSAPADTPRSSAIAAERLDFIVLILFAACAGTPRLAGPGAGCAEGAGGRDHRRRDGGRRPPLQ